MVQMSHSGYVPPDVLERLGRKPPDSPQTAQRDAELMKWKAVEIFKVQLHAFVFKCEAPRLV